MKFLIIIIIALSSSITLLADLLDDARLEYYQAVEQEESIAKAETLFNKLKLQDGYEGLSTIYLGSLTAMKAVHAFWPQSKLEYANSGIDIMEKGLKKDPNNIESLFIYGTTCYYMPFFMGKGEDAEAALKKIIKLYPRSGDNYDPKIIEDALLFILNEIDLTKSEKKLVHRYLGELKPSNG